MNCLFEKMTAAHAKDVLDIFNYYVENSFAAYPTNNLPYEFFSKFLEIPCGLPAFVVKEEISKKILGFCFLKPFNQLSSFKETAEVTYFIEKNSVSKGLGKSILSLLEKEAKSLGIKHLLASISSKNKQSLNFHTKNGFSECGKFHNIGKKNGQNFDVIYMGKELSN